MRCPLPHRRCRITVLPYDRLALTDDPSQALARAASQHNMRILGQHVAAAAGQPLAPAGSTRRLPGAGPGPGVGGLGARAGGAEAGPRASSSLGAKAPARLPVMDGTGQGPVVSPFQGQGPGHGKGQQRGHGRRLQAIDGSASLRRALTVLTADHDHHRHHHPHAASETDPSDGWRRRLDGVGAGGGHIGQHQGRGGAGKAAPVPASGGPREGAAMEACLDRYHRHIVAKYVLNDLFRPLSLPRFVLPLN